MNQTGAPGRATIQPPRKDYIANARRKSNPFVADTEPDWVPGPDMMDKGTDAAVGRKPVPPPPPPRQRTLDEADSLGSSKATATISNPPPAVPRKPISLSAQPSRRDPVSRSPTTQRSLSTQQNGLPVPVEKASTDLLGDATGEQIEWKPLLPQR